MSEKIQPLSVIPSDSLATYNSSRSIPDDIKARELKTTLQRGEVFNNDNKIINLLEEMGANPSKKDKLIKLIDKKEKYILGRIERLGVMFTKNMEKDYDNPEKIPSEVEVLLILKSEIQNIFRILKNDINKNENTAPKIENCVMPIIDIDEIRKILEDKINDKTYVKVSSKLIFYLKDIRESKTYSF